MTERNTVDPPKLRDKRPPEVPTGPTGVPPDRASATAYARSVLPAVRDATARATEIAIETMGDNARFMRSVGIGSVVVALVYLFVHGFLGWFPERRQKELEAEIRALEVQARGLDAELAKARNDLYRCIDDSDGDASGGEESQ